EGMRGRRVALRFEYTQDDSGVCTDVGSAGPCGVAIDNVVFAHVPIVASSCAADLAVAQSHTPEPVFPGAQVAYTIEVSNQGPRDASHVVLTDVIPASSTFVSATGTGWRCEPSTGGVECQLAALAAGARSTVSVVTVAPRRGCTESNVVSVSAAQYD